MFSVKLELRHTGTAGSHTYVDASCTPLSRPFCYKPFAAVSVKVQRAPSLQQMCPRGQRGPQELSPSRQCCLSRLRGSEHIDIDEVAWATHSISCIGGANGGTAYYATER